MTRTICCAAFRHSCCVGSMRPSAPSPSTLPSPPALRAMCHDGPSAFAPIAACTASQRCCMGRTSSRPIAGSSAMATGRQRLPLMRQGSSAMATGGQKLPLVHQGRRASGTWVSRRTDRWMERWTVRDKMMDRRMAGQSGRQTMTAETGGRKGECTSRSASCLPDWQEAP
jgi:hypothetical protein